MPVDENRGHWTIRHATMSITATGVDGAPPTFVFDVVLTQTNYQHDIDRS